MSMKDRIQARRFITMIDTFYDHHTRVIFSAEVPWDDLFAVKRLEDIEHDDDNRKLMDDLGIDKQVLQQKQQGLHFKIFVYYFHL